MCYDLHKIFAVNGLKNNNELNDSLLTIPPDTFLLTKGYANFITFRELKNKMLRGETVDTEELIASNPEYYNAYVLAGDYAFKLKDYSKAEKYYKQALTKVIATKPEKEHIKSQLQIISKKTS